MKIDKNFNCFEVDVKIEYMRIKPNQISCHSGKKYFHKRTSKIYKIKGEIHQQNLNVITKYIQKTLIIKC